jgi:hypothetical protein
VTPGTAVVDVQVEVSRAPRSLLAEAVALLSDDPAAQARLEAARARLDEPLRVALAGKIKAGKSTLLNAFLGEHLAPTDTGECTRVVTWYRAGPIPRVTIHPREGHGRPIPQPVRRSGGRLALSTGGLDPVDVDRIEVRWPSPALANVTLVDTPGLASLSEELSRQSTAALTPDDGVSQVDAVVYLMRHLHASDADFLESFRDQQSSVTHPAMTLAVLSRADEVGAGRIDSLLSANQVAQRYREDPTVRALCLDVVPVAGLLAQGGRTLRQVEFDALVELAQLTRERREGLLISADRFATAHLDEAVAATPAVRSTLIQRLGVFGIRLAVVLVRDGFDTASALSDELVRRSGLDEVNRLLTVQFTARAEALKSRSALLALRRELDRRGDEPGVRPLAERVEAALASRHDLDELQLLSQLRATDWPHLSADEVREAEVVLGGAGTSPAARLRRPEDADPQRLREVAVAAVQRWRRRQDDPELDEPTREACRVLLRSLEGVVAGLPAGA